VRILEQLLDISITYSRLGIHTQQGQFVKTGHDGDSQADLIINNKRDELKMHTTPAKLELNMDEVLDSISPKKISTVAANIREKSHEAASEATAQYERDGEMSMDPDIDAVQQFAKRRVLDHADDWYGIDWIPKVQAKSTFTPEKLDFNVEKGELSIDAQRGQSPFEHRQGGVTTQLEQKGQVTVEYVGGYNYFPDSAQRKLDIRV
jgi:hypothetical protein